MLFSKEIIFFWYYFDFFNILLNFRLEDKITKITPPILRPNSFIDITEKIWICQFVIIEYICLRVFHVLRYLNNNYTTNTGTITISDKYNYVHHGQRENLSLLKGAMLSTYDNTAMSVLYCYSDHSILSHHYYIHVLILSLFDLCPKV